MGPFYRFYACVLSKRCTSSAKYVARQVKQGLDLPAEFKLEVK